MATNDCSEANLVQQIPALQGVNWSAMKNHNCELNKPDTKPKTVHQFYFVKFWPFEDPDAASKISEAEKLLEQLEQEAIRVNDKCKMLRPAWRFGWSQLQKLETCPHKISSGINWAKRLLNNLRIALDKLNFANDHQGVVANKSTFSTKQNTYDGLKRKMLHGSTNLATERQLLREIERSQATLDYATAPRHVLLREIIENVLNESWLYIDEAKYTKMIEKIRQTEVRKQKALSDAIAKGKPWEPCSAKRATQEQIKIVNQILSELKRDHREVMLEIERTKKHLEAFRKDVRVLIEQRREVRRKNFEAQQHLILRRQTEEMNNRYKEYLSMCINNARELARKKDVASLRRLSNWQVKKFMSEWNWYKNFRISYEISILRSLQIRGLSRDGRIKSSDNDTCRGEAANFTMEGPTNMPVPIKEYVNIYLTDSF